MALLDAQGRDVRDEDSAVASLPEFKRQACVLLPSTSTPTKPTSIPTRPGFKLQLPSFTLLGVTTPALDYFSLPATTISVHRTARDEKDAAGLGVLDLPDFIVENRPLSSKSIPPLTPPDETSMTTWKMERPTNGGDLTGESTIHANDTRPDDGTKANGPAMFLNERIDPKNNPSKASIISALSGAGEDNSASERTQTQASTGRNDGSAPAALPANSGGNNAEEDSNWLEHVIDIAVSETPLATGASNVIKVLSHALPCPAGEESGNTPTTALPTLISILQTKLQSNPSPFISVIHAVPSRFPLANLPTSPPGTPNVTAGRDQEDYFNTNIFSSAVPLIDRYGSTKKAVSEAPAPSTPCLAVPPSSVDVALLERFIPPSSAEEYLDLFNHPGPSLLVDRLIELSADDGTLIFIYPTKAGASTFTSKYLGPILDPLLRTMVVIHSLSADLGISLGKMAVTEHLQDFETMRRKLIFLLRRLNRGDIPSSQGSQTSRTKYSLVYSSREDVLVERKVWAEWYAQQETPRIRDIMTKYFQRAQRLPEQPGINSSVLVREIVEGVSKRQYVHGQAPTEADGVEVGVFVIRRSA